MDSLFLFLLYLTHSFTDLFCSSLSSYESPTQNTTNTNKQYNIIQYQEGRPADRNASDKDALAAKVAAKKEKEAAAAAAAAADEGKVKVVRKVKPKKDAGLDDLLNAGLGAAKKKGKK